MSLTKLSNLYLVHMPNCVGLLENGRCARLETAHCHGDSCPLKLTQKEETAAQDRAMQRLRSLDERTQDKIARKYYGGKRVWWERDPPNAQEKRKGERYRHV